MKTRDLVGAITIILLGGGLLLWEILRLINSMEVAYALPGLMWACWVTLMTIIGIHLVIDWSAQRNFR